MSGDRPDQPKATTRDEGPGGPGSGANELRFDASVPRSLAHRSAVAEVLPTDHRKLGDGRFLVAAQIPRSHMLFNDGPQRFHDLLVILEAVRQSGPVVAHSYLDVPLDVAFVLQDTDARVSEPDALVVEATPAQLVCELDLSNFVRRDGMIMRMSGAASVWVNGIFAATVSGTLIGVPYKSYHALRPRSLREAQADSRPVLEEMIPVAGHRVGRQDRRNVFITGPKAHSDRRWSSRLIVRRDHPHFFDHPQDHVPGMLMVEACRQMSVAVASQLTNVDSDRLLPVCLRSKFRRFAGLEGVLELTATAGIGTLPLRGGTTNPVDLVLSQEGETVATVSIDLLEVL